MTKLTCAGHHFHANGDLEVSYHTGSKKRPLILSMRFGFRDGVRCLVDSYCEPACPICGCPEERYHAMSCKHSVAVEQRKDGAP